MLRVCGRQSEVAGLHDCVAKGLVQQFPERGFHLAFQSTIRQVAGSLECRNRLLNASAFLVGLLLPRGLAMKTLRPGAHHSGPFSVPGDWLL